MAGVYDGIQQRLLVLVIEPRAGSQIQPVTERRRCLPVKTDADIVEIGIRRNLVDSERDELRRHERREAVDRELLVTLGEQERAGLPRQRRAVRKLDRGGGRRCEAHLLGELDVLFGIVTPRQRQRRVVDVGEVVGLPANESRGRREDELWGFAAGAEGCGKDVAVGPSLEIA